MHKVFSLFFALLCFAIYPSHSLATQSLPLKLAARPSLKEVKIFNGENRKHLAYEIYVENFDQKPIQLLELEILEIYASGKRQSHKLNGEGLKKIYSSISGEALKAQDPILKPGEAAVLYVFLDFSSFSTENPVVLEHKLQMKAANAGPEIYSIPFASIKTSDLPVIQLSSPLKGKNWFSPNAPSNFSIHRRVIIPLEGTPRIPERFAVDWVKIGENGFSYQGDPTKNESYHAYKAPIYAAAPGKVIAVKDGIPENTPTAKSMAVPITLESIGGNYVMVHLGSHQYAFYAHLIPGSIKVKKGDLLKTGDLIALLGNSGNSTEPHLHFHIIDNENPLRGEGQPFELNQFTHINYEMKLDEKEDPTYFKAKDRSTFNKQSFMNMELADFE